MRGAVRLASGVALVGGVMWLLSQAAWGQNPFPQVQIPTITIQGGQSSEPKAIGTFLQVLFFLTTLTLAPYILAICTAFTRVVITLSFLRTAMGTQQVPPTQVLMGLALFITMYIMAPVGIKIKDEALDPYLKGEITQAVFVEKGYAPIRDFMLAQTREKDILLFLELGRVKAKSKKEIPFYCLLPAFVLSEVKTAFEIGFLIYIPFLVIDMVVASVLMSMGMFMLSPMSISLPFKLLLFVMIDGWGIVVRGLVESFNKS
jgi:flagellar biosynthetic protein FliP